MEKHGGKVLALAKISELIVPVRQQVLSDLLADCESGAARKKLLVRVGELTLFQAELESHGRALLLADVACQHGQERTVPDNWDQWSEGEAYDAHHEVVMALEWAPGRGEGLSPALLDFFDELPRERSDNFAEGLNAAIAGVRIPSLSPENDYGAGPKELTSEEIGKHAHGLARDLLEKTMFLGSYNQDVAHALALAKARGDFKQINQLIL